MTLVLESDLLSKPWNMRYCIECFQLDPGFLSLRHYIKDIFRRYPNQYEGIIATLCDSLDTLDEPEAKASMVWIIGEYAERIDNAEELLETFLETFLEVRRCRLNTSG